MGWVETFPFIMSSPSLAGNQMHWTHKIKKFITLDDVIWFQQGIGVTLRNVILPVSDKTKYRCMGNVANYPMAPLAF